MTSELQTTQAAGPTQRQATVREFLAVVFRRKWLILGLFGVTTATVVTLSLTSPVSYISYGRLLLKRGERSSALDGHRQVYSDWEQDLGSELEVARSIPVLDHAREILKGDPLPGGSVLGIDPKQVDVEVVGKSNVLRLGYVDRDPVAARKVCSALLRAYMDFRERSLGQFSDPKQFFEAEIAKVEEDLTRTQDLRRAFANREGVVDIQDQKQNLLSQLSGLKYRQTDLNARLAEARAIARVMRELRARPEVDMPDPQPTPGGYDAVFELSRRIVEQEARLAQLRERYRDDADEVVSVKGTIESLKALQAREVEARILLVDSRVEVLGDQLTAVNHDIAAVDAQLDSMPNKETRLTEIDRQLGVLKERYESLVKDRDLARVTEHTTAAITVLLLSPAGPATPSNSRDYVRLALAPAFSVVVAVGLAFFLDGLDITVRTARHAEEASEVPVLAAVRERRRTA